VGAHNAKNISMSRNPFTQGTSPSLADVCPEIPIISVLAATNNMSEENILSTDDVSQLFSGILPDGTLCVVRVFTNSDSSVFDSTVSTIAKVRHPAVTLLMGFAIDGARKYLVYEFLQGGSFADRFPSLNWEQILQILDNIATALSHSLGKIPSVFHGRLKASKVMLDEHGLGKLCDLGLYTMYPEQPRPTVESEILAFQDLMRTVPTDDWPENVAHAFANLRAHPPLTFRLVISDLRRVAAMDPGPMALFGLSWDGVTLGTPSRVDREVQTDPLIPREEKQSANQCCSLS
jgi:serine/threonine protein kinase